MQAIVNLDKTHRYIAGAKRPILLNTAHSPISICRRIVIVFVLMIPAVARAEPSQDAVFKSISNNVDSSVSGKTVLAGVMVVGGLILLMAYLSQRQQKSVSVRTVNSQTKLMRELIKTAGLKPSEAKQLRNLADRLAKAGRPVDSPVTLMLAPSWVRGDRSDKQG